MSLLDDVSIVVTPNGYKAGELYAVVPVPTEGAEEVTNGDFATDSDWSKGTGWTISGGTANCDGTGGNAIYQDVSGVQNTRYAITLTISGYTSGTLQIGGSTNNLEVNSNGTFTHYRTWTSDTILYLKSKSGDGFNGSIDNVSVKEYTAADMDVTRATAATRVDENGLVNYAEVLGGDLVNTIDNDNTYPFPTFTDNGGGSYTMATTTTAYSGFEQPASDVFAVAVGEIYKLTFDFVLNSGALDLELFIGSGAVGSSYGNRYTCQVGSNTAFITIITSNSSARLASQINQPANMTISNIVLKKLDRDNVPRIDYTGGGCPHILAEPQRTNLITYSEDFTSWNQIQNITLTANSTTSPSGDSDGTKFLSTSSGAKVRANFSAVSGTTYTLSLYCKNIDATLIKLLCYDGVNSFSNQFQSEVNTSTWTRISFTFTAANTATGQIQIARDLPDTESAYFWGAQLEEGSYATSYIPTSGSTVTRNQDIFTRDGIGSLIGQTEGTFFAEISKPITIVPAFESISLNNAASNSDANGVVIGFLGDDFAIRVQSNNSAVFASYNTVASANTFHKVAISYKSGASLIYVNGNPITPSSGSLAGAFSFTVTLDNLSFDLNGNNSLPFNGKVKQLQVYDTALTDVQLAALTS